MAGVGMRGSHFEVRRSFGAFFESFDVGPLRAASALGVGVAFGVIGVLVAAPLSVSASDDSIRAVLKQDARGRGALHAEPAAGYFARATTSRFDDFFRPIVRSFAPSPRQPRFIEPPAIVYSYAPSRAVQPIRIMDQTGGPRRATVDAADKPKASNVRVASLSSDARSVRPTTQLTRRTVCVRLCDGYHFPIGNLASNSDLPVHEAMCQAACPDADAKIFTLEAGATVEQAVSRDLRRYASLPAAFAYRTNRSASCTCNRNIAQNHLSIFRDPTLRAGDLVVTGERAVVFNGAKTWPLKPKDFTDFSASTRLTSTERRNVDALVGVTYAANLLKPYAIVQQARERDAPRVIEANIIRPPQARSEIVRQVYDVGAEPRQARGIVALSGPVRSLRVVDNRAVPGFVVR